MFAVAVGLCVLAFLTSYIAGRRSLALSLSVTFFWGYYFGILRANVLSPASHFIFDAGLMGCYVSHLFQKVPYADRLRYRTLSDWITALTGWTFLIALLPFQVPAITLVGLRGNYFMVPAMLLVARLTEAGFRILVTALAILNISTLGFGFAEYFMGVEPFFPVSGVTALIYLSHDAGDNYRIPSVFSNAHSYAMAMVSTLPLMLTMVGLPHANKWQRLLCLLGAVSSMGGVLFSSTRTNFVIMGVTLVCFLLVGKMKFGIKALLLLIVLAGGASTLSNERFQRFQALQDGGIFSERLAGSVNMSLLEVFLDYPMGNGLGGGGTSVPYFLANQIRHGVNVENEYARLALELGFPGLLIWLFFLAWVLIRGFRTDAKDPWRGGRKLMCVYLFLNFATAMIGTGMLTAIPGTLLMMVHVGWLTSRPPADSFIHGGGALAEAEA